MARSLENLRGNKASRDDPQMRGSFLVKESVRCIDCVNALELEQYPSLVKCAAGEPPPLCGFFWKTDRRGCLRFHERDKADQI